MSKGNDDLEHQAQQAAAAILKAGGGVVLDFPEVCRRIRSCAAETRIKGQPDGAARQLAERVIQILAEVPTDDLVERHARRLAVSFIGGAGWPHQVEAMCEALGESAVEGMNEARRQPEQLQALADRAQAILREVAEAEMGIDHRGTHRRQ